MKTTKKILVTVFSVIFFIFSFIGIKSVYSKEKSPFTTQKVYGETREQKIETAIKRADYILNFRWTAVNNVTGWGYTFTAGNSYTIPYSQPYNHGGYLFYNITLEYFEQQSKIASSKVYARNTVGDGTYYGLDCSSFAAFCLGVTTRCTTYTFESWANANSNGFYYKNYSTVAKGDLLNSNSVGHVLVVGNVNGDYISCYESTPQYRSGRADICYTTKTKAQWQAIGYYVLGYDYRGTGAPYDDVTARLTSSNKDNHVVGDCTDAKADTSWNLSKNYSPNNANYSSRTATLSSSSGDNVLYFNQTKASTVTVQSKFKVTGKEKSELFGKFGLSFVNASGKGFLFYCNAEGTEGTSASNVTGTSIGIIGRNGSDWQWGTETEVKNKWNASSPVTLKIERIGGYFKCYADGKVIFTALASDYGLVADEQIYPQIRSFNVHLTATEYSAVATHNSMVIDGKFDDWKNNANFSKIEADKKSVADKNNTDKNATFYHRLTEEGLFIYAIAHHSKTTSGSENWWENTNFEMFINSDDNKSQFFVSEDLVSGFTSFAFLTTGSSGNYTSVLEGFIDNSVLSSKANYENGQLNVGYAFKVDNGTVKDEITPVGTSTATSYWCAENSEPRKVAHKVVKESAYEKGYIYEVADKGNWKFNGNDLSISSCLTDGDDIIYFRNNATTTHTFKATFSLKGKVSTEEYGKIGIAYVDEYGDGFFFYANAEGGKGNAGVSAITGTDFGIVFSDNGNYLWNDTKSKALTGATFSASQPFSMKVVRENKIAKLYANDVLLTSITLDDYKIPDNRLCYPALISFNIYANATNVGFENPSQDSIVFDGDLSDWQALKEWDTIQANKIAVTDKTNANKGVTFYTLLNDKGLFVAVKATHSVNLFGYSDWWKNTNVEAFIGSSDFNHQFYATKQFRYGWTKSEFTTTGTNGNYVTVFEGFIDYEYLTNVCCMTNNQIKIGLAFKVDNLNGTADKITPNGSTTATSYWCAENTDPLALSLTVTKLTQTEPEQPDVPSSSSSSSKDSSSKSSSISKSETSKSSESSKQSSSASSESSKNTSSESSKIISSSSSSTKQSSDKASSTTSKDVSVSSKTNSDENSSDSNSSLTDSSGENDSKSLSSDGKTSNKGCKSFANSDLLFLLPVCLFAMIILIKKSKKN